MLRPRPNWSLFRPVDHPPPSSRTPRHCWKALRATAHSRSWSTFCILLYFWPLEVSPLFLNKPFRVSLVIFYVSLLYVRNREVGQGVNLLRHLNKRILVSNTDSTPKRTKKSWFCVGAIVLKLGIEYHRDHQRHPKEASWRGQNWQASKKIMTAVSGANWVRVRPWIHDVQMVQIKVRQKITRPVWVGWRRTHKARAIEKWAGLGHFNQAQNHRVLISKRIFKTWIHKVDHRVWGKNFRH